MADLPAMRPLVGAALDKCLKRMELLETKMLAIQTLDDLAKVKNNSIER